MTAERAFKVLSPGSYFTVRISSRTLGSRARWDSILPRFVRPLADCFPFLRGDAGTTMENGIFAIRHVPSRHLLANLLQLVFLSLRRICCPIQRSSSSSALGEHRGQPPTIPARHGYTRASLFRWNGNSCRSVRKPLSPRRASLELRKSYAMVPPLDCCDPWERIGWPVKETRLQLQRAVSTNALKISPCTTPPPNATTLHNR